MPQLRSGLLLTLVAFVPGLRAAEVPAIPLPIHREILTIEDDRRWTTGLENLMRTGSAASRQRAILAAGRIGDARAVPVLAEFVSSEPMPLSGAAAFALGEIESADGAGALLELIAPPLPPGMPPSVAAYDREIMGITELHTKAVEALGKIASAPSVEPARKEAIGRALLSPDTLPEATAPRRADFTRLKLLGLTALLRARPEGAGRRVASYLSDPEAEIRAAALNVLARLRAAENLPVVRTLAESDADPIVRANGVRVLGAAKDKPSLALLSGKSLQDADQRVRVSAIRALALLEDPAVVTPLMQRGAALLTAFRARRTPALEHPGELNELLEIATALGTLLRDSANPQAVEWLRSLRSAEPAAPEVEIAFARIAPAVYLKEDPFPKTADPAARSTMFADWRRVVAQAEGLGEIAAAEPPRTTEAAKAQQSEARDLLRAWMAQPTLPVKAAPGVLNELAAAKPDQFDLILRIQLGHTDVDLRAMAASLMADRPPTEENSRALLIALTATARDNRNDAALAILDAIAAQKSTTANEAIRVLLRSPDYLVRMKVAGILRAAGAADVPLDLGRTNSRVPAALYDRALGRIGKRVEAHVQTAKGAVVIELLPETAPLTVDNFIELAGHGYFNGLTFHRVVPNFVIQGGDPRGDGSGGPGYQIRCEINEVPFERGAVGMALSGKDTGGSQWFITHSPQPHLDGGYTVFGRVTSGMEVVDQIARGDLIQRITISM